MFRAETYFPWTGKTSRGRLGHISYPPVSGLNLMVEHTVILGLFGLPLDSIFSTQGIMVALLLAYGGAMWLFLTSSPKVYTIMVSDLEIARSFYEGDLRLSIADMPLQYYYNYEQTLGTTAVDPLYLAPGNFAQASGTVGTNEGLWYQLKKNVQVHIVGGASLGDKDQQRHLCFDRDCLEQLLFRSQARGLKHKIRRDRPVNFLVKDWQGRIIEFAEIES